MIADGLLDTSVFIALESGRPIKQAALPSQIAVSVITVAELRAGVLAANDNATRSRRLSTLESVMALQPLPVGTAAAAIWAELRVALAEGKKRININDLWIASVALANHRPVVTQDADFDPLVDMASLTVIRV